MIPCLFALCDLELTLACLHYRVPVLISTAFGDTQHSHWLNMILFSSERKEINRKISCLKFDLKKLLHTSWT